MDRDRERGREIHTSSNALPEHDSSKRIERNPGVEVLFLQFGGRDVSLARR